MHLVCEESKLFLRLKELGKVAHSRCKKHDQQITMALMSWFNLWSCRKCRSHHAAKVRYLLNCTFLTNTNSLLHLGEWLLLLLFFVDWIHSPKEPSTQAWLDSFSANPSRLFACAVRNLPQLCMRWLTSTPEPWNFAWGYWYAFTLGILSTVVWMQRRMQAGVVVGQLQVPDIWMLLLPPRQSLLVCWCLRCCP